MKSPLSTRLLLIRSTIALLIVLLVALLLSHAAPQVAEQLNLECATDGQTTNKIPNGIIAGIKMEFEQIGLHDTSVFNRSGVVTHIQRLCREQVSLEQLQQYIDQLKILANLGQNDDQQIPINFWDVSTSAMRRNQLTEYWLIDDLVTNNMDYLILLAKSYNRFYQFKMGESSDTALDTALDIFLYVVEYYAKTNPEPLSIETRQDIVRTWQRIIGHEPRINPLTGELLIEDTPLSHLSVTNMWRYQTRRNTFIGSIWGISGFDNRFVGNPKNTNQVEHLAITLLLQYVENYSLIALNAFEVQDTLSGGQTSQMATADRNINNLIASEFIPRFDENPIKAIEHMKCIIETDSQHLFQCTNTSYPTLNRYSRGGS